MNNANFTVLLVDDEKDIVSVVREFLVLQGYTVLPAVGAREGLRVSLNYPGIIDLLLTDVVMPFFNGRELANRVSRDRPGIKVLFMSAYSYQVILSHGVVPEGVNLIQKPFKLPDLKRTVREVLDRSDPWSDLSPPSRQPTYSM